MSSVILDVPRAHRNPVLEQPAGPLLEVLSQLDAIIDHLSDSQYTAAPVGVFTSSIGAHVRHCLDHVRELVKSSVLDELDYDRRMRGTDIESSRTAAMQLIAELQRRLIELPPEAMTRPVWISATMISDGPPATVYSSVGREIAFVLSHTIHHNALIAAMVKTLGGWLPDRFGYAPSTVAFQESRRCARSA